MEEMLDRYKSLSKKPTFAEAYYQVYPRYYKPDVIREEIIPYNKYVNQKTKEKGIIRTGSTDSHSKVIFD